MDVVEQTIEEFIQHQKFSDDLFANIFKKTVTEYKEESNRQVAIRAMVSIYENKYKPEMRRHNEAMKEAREASIGNEFAANQKDDIQHSFRIPDTLFSRLQSTVELIDPEGPGFMSEESFKELKEDIWFAKNFPQYLVPAKY